MITSEIEKLIPSWILNSEIYSVTITDLEGKYIYTNKVFHDRFSFITDDFIGKPFEITMHKDDVEKANIAAVECMNNPNKNVQLYIRKPIEIPESYYWTNWEFSLFSDKNNQPVGIMCLGHDVTEEKLVQKKLKESEGKLSAILNSTIHSNVLLNPELEVVYFNRVAAEDMKRYFDKEIKIGDNYLDFVLPTNYQAFLENFNKALKGEVIKVEWKADFKEDSYYETTFFPVLNENNKIFGVAFNTEDISLKKKVELKVIEQNNRLKDIAWSQSHKIRGPLSSIMSIVNLVNSEVDEKSKLEMIQYLDKATISLDNVIREIVEKTNLEENL